MYFRNGIHLAHNFKQLDLSWVQKVGISCVFSSARDVTTEQHHSGIAATAQDSSTTRSDDASSNVILRTIWQ